MAALAGLGLAGGAAMGALVAHRRGGGRGSGAQESPPTNSAVSPGGWQPAMQPASGEAFRHYRAGLELLESGNPAQAAVRLEKARHREPAKGSIREALGRAYYMLGRWPEAEWEFRHLLEIAPTNDYGHYCLSRVLKKLGRHDEAVAHLKLARAMRPGLQPYGL